jgi:hypothetical protein
MLRTWHALETEWRVILNQFYAILFELFPRCGCDIAIATGKSERCKDPIPTI